MFDSDYQKKLLMKAVEEERMSDAELRDFASVLIEDPEAAEEFAFARRLAGDAANLPRAAAPSATFTDRVMGAVEAAPPPVATASPPRRPAWAAAAAVLILAGVGVSLAVPGWDFFLGGADASVSNLTEWFDGIWPAVEPVFSTDWFSGPVSSAAGVVVWLAVGLPLLAGTLNYWSVRRSR